jgi:hypothetical protein
MESDRQKPSAEAINVLLAKIKNLEPQEVSVISNLVDLLQHRADHTGDLTDAELRQLSLESLKRGWGPEDDVYDSL